jgi:glycosyltransferase involved in cell wall biosynthesis
VKLRLGGKPVITSVGELIDLIINGKTGALVEPGNTQRLTIEIFRILNSDGEAKDMGLKAKEFVNQK